MIHNFHFVLTEFQKDRIKKIAKKLNMSKSSAVIYIIKIMKPFLERHFYYSMKDERSEYQQFGAEENIHVILDEKSYNIIKHITDNMYIFSMAITLRKILDIFMDLVEKLGLKNVVEKLKKIRYKHLKRMENYKNITKVGEFKQLSKSHPLIRNIKRYYIEFSRFYTVLNFNFIT